MKRYPAQVINHSDSLCRKEKEREAFSLFFVGTACAVGTMNRILRRASYRAYFSHLMISGSVGFLPYIRTPTR